MASSGPFGMTARPHFLRSLDLSATLNASEGGQRSGVKVVATIGPACHSVEQLGELLDAGTVGARFDLTWGPLDFHRSSLANLQAAMALKQKLCCTMIDTLGRELMIRRQIKIDEQGWPVHEERFTVEAGQQVIVTTRVDAVASGTVLPITYESFTDMAEPGDTIYVGRYLVCGADSASLYLEVVSVKGPDVFCIAKNSAVLEGLLTVFHTERSTDTLLNVQNTLPLLSQYDKEAIMTLAQDYEVDYLNLSYVRSEDDIHEARAWLSSVGLRNTRLLAKIETRQSLLNFEGILSAADGIVISRGNLGLDCPPEKMAMVQKTLIHGCNMAGKPCLITRVVDTMVENPRPTRAEATDVANAVLDGVDGILLGAETLRGRFPIDTVRTITRICHSAEAVFDHTYHYDFLMELAMVHEESRANSMPQATGLQDLWGSLQVMPSQPHGTATGATTTPAPTTPPVPVPGGAASTNGSLHGGSAAGAAMAAGGHQDSSIAEALLAASPNGSASDVLHVSDKQSKSPVAPGHGTKGGVLPPKARGTTPTMTKSVTEVALSGAAVAATPHMAHGMGSLATERMSLTNIAGLPNHNAPRAGYGPWRSPYLSKMESIASSAVRVAHKIQASLMLVYTHTGATAALVAKYRPPTPILTLVVPQLVSDGLKWKMEGRAHARHCLLNRALLPLLVNPSAEGDENLNYAIEYAASLGIVKPHDHIVCVQRAQNDICIKVVSVDQLGYGVKRVARSTTIMRRSVPPPQSLPYVGTPSALMSPSDRLAERIVSATTTPPPS